MLSIVLSILLVESMAKYVIPHVRPAEGPARVSGPDEIILVTETGKRLRPNVDVVIRNHFVSDLDVRFTTNELGFRDGPIAIPKPPDEFRVLAIGDSITCGDYLPAEQVYVKVLQRGLNERAASEDAPRIRVINAGVGDIGVRGAVNILEDPGLSVEPDLVLVGYYLNDCHVTRAFASTYGQRNWLAGRSVVVDQAVRSYRLWKWSQEHSESIPGDLNDLLKLDWRNDPQVWEKLAYARRSDWGAAWSETSWPFVIKQFDRLKALSEAHGFAVAVAVFPVKYQVLTKYVPDRPQRLLADLAAERGWPVLDLLPMLREYQDEVLFFDHCHPTALGNQLIGDALSQWLSEQPLLRRAAHAE